MLAIAVTFFTGSLERQYKDTVVFPPKEKPLAIFLTYTRCEWVKVDSVSGRLSK